MITLNFTQKMGNKEPYKIEFERFVELLDFIDGLPNAVYLIKSKLPDNEVFEDSIYVQKDVDLLVRLVSSNHMMYKELVEIGCKELSMEYTIKRFESYVDAYNEALYMRTA